MSRAAARTEFFCNDHFDHHYSRYRLPVPDCGCVAAERKERRFGCGFRRSGQPDSVWPARSRFSSLQSNHVVRDHLHVDVDHAFDLRSAPIRPNVRANWNEGVADKIAASNAGPGGAANRSPKSGSHTEIAESVEQRASSRPFKVIRKVVTNPSHDKPLGGVRTGTLRKLNATERDSLLVLPQWSCAAHARESPPSRPATSSRGPARNE